MYSPIVFATLLIFSTAIHTGISTRPSPQVASEEKPCSFMFGINPRDLESKRNRCPQIETNEQKFNDIPIEQILSPHERKDLGKQRYRVEYSDTCRIGLEIVSGCHQNPDEQACPDGSVPYLRIIKFDGGVRNGQVLSQTRLCPGEEQPVADIPQDQLIQIIRVTPEQFRRFPIEPSALNSDPKQFSLRNGHTHLWANAETQTFGTDINGTHVDVRAIPIQWQWNYGDGTRRSLNDPGKPEPGHTLHHETPTSHSYTKTGIFDVNLTTLYRGEFRVSGGSWQAIPGQAAVPSEPIFIDVWRTKKQLIAPDGE